MTPTLDPVTRDALTGLDPAPRTLDAAQQARADATLARILDGPPAPEVTPAAPPVRRRGPRLAVVGGLATAVTVGIVGVQVLQGGDTAYATWTATPSPPTTPQELEASDACRDSLAESLVGEDGTDPTGVTENRIRRAGVVLAERRGDWTLVVLGDDGGLDASCVTQDGRLFGGVGFGSMGVSPLTDAQGREILVTSGGAGGSSGEMMTVLFGLAGPEVESVIVHTPDHGDVAATVSEGHLAAWWPGPVDPDGASPGFAPPATVTYTDGTSWTGVLGVESETPS